MSKPKAVIISDTHYSLNTREIADKAWRMAVDKAAELGVPLIDAGDLTNDKSHLNATVVNTLIETILYATSKQVEVYLLVGNHSLVNEKGKEHALNFLRPYANVIESFDHVERLGLWFIPYQSSTENLIDLLDSIPEGSTIIMHQGVDKAWGGHYVHDKTAAPSEWFQHYRVVSGHYHRKQDIECGPIRDGKVGLFSYIGNPYSLTFGEASDGPKGFQILMDDGSLEFVPTNLRKHVIIDWKEEHLFEMLTVWENTHPNPGDIVWMKISGLRSNLDKLNKHDIGKLLYSGQNFKLDLIPTNTQDRPKQVESLTSLEVLNKLIDGLPDSAEYRSYLKDLANGVLE